MKLLLPNPMADPRPVALSPLEEGLRGPDAAALQEQTQVQLKDLESRVRSCMATQVLPERYRALEVLLDACLSAQEVLVQDPLRRPQSAMGASVRLA